MKVIQVLPKMDLGGVERGVLDLAKYFKEEMVVISGGGRLIAKLKEEGVTCYNLPIHKKSPLTLRLIRKVRKIIQQEKAEIVHARSRVPAWVTFFATRGRDIPFITTAHGAYSKHTFSKVMGWGKFVICPSKVIARHMMKNFGVSEEKIRIISRWVDLSRFTFKDPSQRLASNIIVSIGRISPSKGFEYLIQAFHKVIRVKPYLNLLIVGEAEKSKWNYFEYLKNLVRRLSLDYHVEFLGYQSNVERILEKASLMVVPSVAKESFGRVVVEAFASGVPVIATKVGALEEIVEDKKNGILVLPGDSNQIKEAILTLIDNPSLARKLAYNGRKKVETLYTLQNCYSKILQTYREAIEFKRILVIKVSSLGDVVLAIPSLKAIKESFPKSKLVVLTLKKYASLFYEFPFVDKVIGIDRDYKKMKRIIKISNSLRRESFDYIIDLQNNLATHLIAFLSFPQKSFGFSRKLGFLLTSSVKFPKERINPLQSQNRILRLLGIEIKERKLIMKKPSLTSIEKLGLSGEKNLIGISVSASVRWKTKNWPIVNIIKLIEFIRKEFPSYKIVLVGDSHSREAANHIRKNFKDGVINLCGKTNLKELIVLLSILKVFVCQDTATLHISAALGVETVALFGPTDPKRHIVESRNLYVLYKQLPCSFCYKPRCRLNTCMKSISPQEVFRKIKEIIER